MVMHARKPQRINDGYFEKHSAHPYQKYNTKNERRAGGEFVSSESYYSPLKSPNGNVSHSSHPGHGYHHYNHCVDERGYVASRNSYLQKGCEKERDRDYKYARDKYADSDNRSPKEKRIKDSEREHSNHERSDTDKKIRTSGVNSVSRSNKYDKRCAPSTSASEWSEHISSSGKRYYYNCISEVSQWEKPREWDPRRTTSKETSYAPKNNHDKRLNTVRTGREPEKPIKRTNSGISRYWNANNRGETEVHDRARPKRSVGTYEDGQSLQDMDISPDRSTPFSDNSYRARRATSIGTINRNNNNSEYNAAPPVVVLDNTNYQNISLLAAALPRIVSVQTATNNGAVVASPSGDTCGTTASGSAGTPHRDAGPPTPTHSENIDPHAPPMRLETALPRKMECLGSYSSVVGSSNIHAPPMLTPSLVNYVRSDLTSHVTGWPSDILERQANKFADDAYHLASLNCTRVSADLKCTRSIVRHMEIQATLQEQKLMYMQQQITRLEELKSQNAFMAQD